ncbi:MAG: hypothetical protein AAB879_03275 [Patescibacteria group bacterium]
MAWLFLDTSRPDHFRLGILSRTSSHVVRGQGRSSRLLPALARRFSARELDRVTGICVVHGPGAFSSVRGGVLSANLLARLLRKPLVGISVADAEDLHAIGQDLEAGHCSPVSCVMPTYTSPPNITMCRP